MNHQFNIPSPRHQSAGDLLAPWQSCIIGTIFTTQHLVVLTLTSIPGKCGKSALVSVGIAIAESSILGTISQGSRLTGSHTRGKKSFPRCHSIPSLLRLRALPANFPKSSWFFDRASCKMPHMTQRSHYETPPDCPDRSVTSLIFAFGQTAEPNKTRNFR